MRSPDAPVTLEDSSQGARVFAAVGLPGIKKLLGFVDGTAGTVYVPDRYSPQHALALLLGEEPFLRLIATCGGETLACLGTLGLIDQGRRMRRILDGLRATDGNAEATAAEVGVSARQVSRVKARMTSPHRPDF